MEIGVGVKMDLLLGKTVENLEVERSLNPKPAKATLSVGEISIFHG
jgi:hypothetical protein